MDESNFLVKKEMNRRAFLRGAVAAGVPLATFIYGGPAEGQAPPIAARHDDAPLPGLIVREKMPENLEFPFSTLDTYATPNDRFYIRSHFPVPALDIKSWRLKVEGAVRTPLELSYEDLLKMQSKTITATLECAGNGRVFLSPAVKGAQWELGGVSNAEWTGIPLAAILKRAGIRPSAVEVVLEGADSGEIKDPPKPAGAIHFARSLPLSRAALPEVLLATRMNGEDLPASHGFPLRAVVPGWYGVASVKWLTRLIVTETPFNGYFQTIDYAMWERNNGLPTRVPLTEMGIKSQISRPDIHELITAGSTYRVYGAAWTGNSDVATVEVSSNGGQSWQAATLLGRPIRHAWRFWEYAWRVPSQRGRYTLLAKATDARGEVQPMQRQQDRENYAINHVLPVDVDVR